MNVRLALTTVALCAASANPAAAQTRMLIVSGLGGEAKYSTEFASLSERLADAAVKRFGMAPTDVVWLGEDSVSKRAHFGGQSTKQNVERVLQRFATAAANGGQTVVVLIGHGSGEGPETRISLPGPDITARELGALLDRFGDQRIAFVDLTSASGDALPVVSAPNRVVITATKSAFERNESHFAQFFVDALTKDVADVDKDGRVSLLEAYTYATIETKRVYDTDSRLQTEHAQLDDMGAKAGVATPDGRTGQGLLARRFYLDAGRVASNDPRIAALYKDKFALEDQIDQLRGKKPTMAADAYDDALEALLVKLARTSRSIRELEGKKS